MFTVLKEKNYDNIGMTICVLFRIIKNMYSLLRVFELLSSVEVNFDNRKQP